jgi:hypothetical protein
MQLGVFSRYMKALTQVDQGLQDQHVVICHTTIFSFSQENYNL